MKFEGPITLVEFDVHRWFTFVNIHFEDGSKASPVIGNSEPGEGPSFFDSYEEWEGEL